MFLTNNIKKFIIHFKKNGIFKALYITYKYLNIKIWRFMIGKLQIYYKNKIYKKYKISFNENSLLFKPDYIDLNNLINQIIKIKPKHVLELGGGQSTYILIYALTLLEKEGHNFTFTTLDQSEKYLEETKKNIPSIYHDKINFISSSLKVEMEQGELMSFFNDIPDKPYDFVYEDRCDHAETKIAGDIVRLEKKAIKDGRNFSFTLDAMTATRDSLKKLLKRKYSVSGASIHGINFVQK